MGRSFLAAADLAGSFAARAVTALSQGVLDEPLLGVERDGERSLVAFPGLEWLDANPDDVERAVLILDAVVTIDGVDTDALVLDARQYGDPVQRLEVLLTYRPYDHPDGFAVDPPRFTAMDAIEDEAEMIYDAFFRGVEAHSSQR